MDTLLSASPPPPLPSPPSTLLEAGPRPNSQQQQKHRQVQGAVEALESMLRTLEDLQVPLKQHLISDQDSRHAQERLEGIVGLCKKQLAANRVYAARSLQPRPPSSTGALQSPSHVSRLSITTTGEDSPFSATASAPHHSSSFPSRRNKRMSVSTSVATGRSGKASVVAPPPSGPPPSYGVCLSSGLHFMLESLLIRTEAERLTLFVQNAAGELCAAMRVGAGVAPVTKETPITTTSLLQVVRATGMAANLSSVDLADVSECPGPTTAKNTLIFPLPNFVRPHRIEGCIQLINKRKGLEPFGPQDEVTVQQLRPSVACFLHRYPLPIPLPPFDPAPLYQWTPLPQFTLPTIGLDATLTAVPKQLVFHRSPGDRFTAKFWMNNLGGGAASSMEGSDSQQMSALDETQDGGGRMVRVVGDSLSAAASLLDAEAYMKTMDDCWRSSVAENMLLERMVQQKQSHINDAREIISRKQKKLELLKSTLVDEVDRHLRGTSALHAVDSGGPLGVGLSPRGALVPSHHHHGGLQQQQQLGQGGGRVQRRKRRTSHRREGSQEEGGGAP